MDKYGITEHRIIFLYLLILVCVDSNIIIQVLLRRVKRTFDVYCAYGAFIYIKKGKGMNT